MKLSKTEFKTLIESIPFFYAEVEWDNNKGYLKLDSYELQAKEYVVFIDAHINAYGKTFRGNYYTPGYFEILGKEIEITDIQVFTEDDSIEVKLTKQQKDTLTNHIINHCVEVK